MRETTSLGAAIAAGLAAKFWDGVEDLKKANDENRTIFQPEMPKHLRNHMYKKWEKAVEMSRGWADSNDEDTF